MKRVASLFLPQLAIERLRRTERPTISRPEVRQPVELPVDDDPGACSVPRGGDWRPGARWARDGGQTREQVRAEVATMPVHRQPPIAPDKPRSGRRQRLSVPITEEEDNPSVMLDFLEARTANLRPSAGARAGRVFLYRPRHRGNNNVCSLDVADVTWRTSLEAFCTKHKLPVFTLKQLRPTTLDLVHDLSGGDILKVSAMANHKSFDTTMEFYESDAMRRRDQEKLGLAVSQFQRWRRTDGRVDARVRDRSVDVGAATPGFHCSDPNDSWIAGQKRGDLCTAYGMCPICPRALVDTNSVHAFVYLQALRKKIDEAQQRSDGAAARLARWAPVQNELLTYWLELFPKEVREKGKVMSLPNLPQVE